MIYINGRPDGLGNRIEELIIIEAYCIKYKTKAEYYWNNVYKHRMYPILLKCTNIHIQDKYNYSVNDSLCINEMRNDLVKDELFAGAKNIDFHYTLPYVESYTAIHIRSTDKLLNRGRDEFSNEVFEDKFNKTLSIINSQSNLRLVICSDDPKYKKQFLDSLNEKHTVIDLYNDIDIDPVYKDYMKLVNAKSIYMVPKFSSYAATASILGNNILYSHFNEEDTALYRYKCNIQLI